MKLSIWDMNLAGTANREYIFPHPAHPISERMVQNMDLNKIVCSCYSITNGMIKEAVDNGANTLEEVQEATSEGTACGACLDDVQRLVEEFVAERDR